MIESCYWRQELKSDVAWLRQHATFRRWTEKQMVLFERRLILTAFQIRVLIEQKRIRSSISARSLQCTWHRKVGSRPVTRLNAHRFDQHFAMEKPETVRLNAWDLSNQLIHHYEMYALAEFRRFASLALFSDYARNKGLYIISIPDVLDYFALFAKDNSAVSYMRSTWNPKKQDYDVVVE